MTPRDLLSPLRSRRALDVATGQGTFIRFLKDHLGSSARWVGLDSREDLRPRFLQNFVGEPEVHFVTGDAHRLPDEDHSFDLVSVASSLHHFTDPRKALGEMWRVLVPGGHLVVTEMYRDVEPGPQQTHVGLHDWWAELDRRGGGVHHPTFHRQEILDLVQGLPCSLATTDHQEPSPDGAELREELEAMFTACLTRAQPWPELADRGRGLKQLVSQVGFAPAASLLLVATKPISV